MAVEPFEIRVRGKTIQVPSAAACGQRVLVRGRWLKLATVHDEEWLPGDVVADPAAMIREFTAAGLRADIFTFSQKLPDTQPRHGYPFEWDNVAAIPTSSFKEWWEKRLPQVTRKNVRRSAKRGVVVRTCELNDELVRGIVEIYGETLIKQGIPFAHHGKDFETVKKEVSTLPDRSEFICAYHGEELIGFIKLVHLGPIASILHIVSKERHYDKRPMNALVTRAVEICEQKKIGWMVYGKYVYGNKTDSPLAEFKRRNGFEPVNVPTYYVPLTLKGRVAVRLKLYRGWLGILPPGLIKVLLAARARFYSVVLRKGAAPAAKEDSGEEGEKPAEAQAGL
ncbi:MAG: hypothetical protein U1F98_17185 [Verrucomicrobiota bacterium]